MVKKHLFHLFFLGGIAVTVGGGFLSHRHGQFKGFVDANKNGVDDRIENPRKAGAA